MHYFFRLYSTILELDWNPQTNMTNEFCLLMTKRKKQFFRGWKMKNSIKMMESDMPADSGRRAKNKAEQEIPGGYC